MNYALNITEMAWTVDETHLPRHWHPEPIKRGRQTLDMWRNEDVMEMMQQLKLAIIDSLQANAIVKGTREDD